MNLDDLDLYNQQLAGGISQQPEHLRFPGQVADAENVDFSVADGIRKRPGTRFEFRVTGLTAGVQYRLHAIERDSSEHYLVVIGSTVLKVFSTAGTAGSVTDVSAGGAALSYIQANSAVGADFRSLSIADTTIIANTTVPLAASATAVYTVTSEWPDYDTMRSHTPAAQTYHRTTGDSPNYPAGYYFYDPSPDISGDVTFAVATFNTVSVATWASPTGNWDNAGSYGFQIRFQRRNITATSGWTWTQSTKRLTKAGSGVFGDYIWRFNDEVNVTNGGSAPITTGWARVARRIDADTIELVTDLGADSTGVSIDAIGDGYEVFHVTTGTQLNDMHAVAKSLENSLRAAGCADGLIGWESTGLNAGRFVVTCPYRGSTRTILSVSAPSGGTDLTGASAPFNSFTVAAAAGSGDPILAVDARWTRVAGPGSADGSIDETAAPVKLTRTSVSPLEFELDVLPWNDRVAGDADSNPSPSIFRDGERVGDLAYHRGRFGIGASDRIVFSRAGDIFNFYLEDPTNPVDSDPIDLRIASDRVSIVDYLVPWRNTLAILTRAGRQFELTNPDAFTPSTAGIDSSTQYPTRQARPASLGSRMYFATDNGGRSGVREYFRDENSVASDAADVTAHVPTLIPSDVQTLLVHATSQRLFALERSTNTIYVYRTFFVGQSKQQSAWSKWTFEANYRIADMAMIADRLWLLVERGSGNYAVESMAIGDEVPDDGMPYVVRMDRTCELTGVYDGVKTTFTLPTGMVDSSINTIVRGADFDEQAGRWLSAFNLGGTSVYANGDYTDGPCYIGRRFPASVTLTRPFVRDDRGNADLRRTLLCRRMVLNYSPSGWFEVAIDAPPRPTVSQNFRPANSFDTAGGRFSAWPLGDVAGHTVRITSTSPTPLVVTGIQRVCDIGEAPV